MTDELRGAYREFADRTQKANRAERYVKFVTRVQAHI